MPDQLPNMQGMICPTPLPHQDRIVLGHGSGGKLSHALIERVFRNAFDNPILRVGDDSAVVAVEDDRQQAQGRIAISTDSHVVSPLFFPGGDIGRLAICGTVNDLAMNGARPLYLTVGFILEEGLAISELEAIVQSMKIAATEAGIQIVAGDTKVVQKGKADGVYINTTGIGWIDPHMNISGANAQAGDVVIISGTVGDHGMAVLQARGDLGFTANITSDVAPLNHLTQVMMNICPEIHVLRDPTRGGLATTLNEIAAQSKVGIILDEQAIPVQPVVASACEMLGFDPLYVANEGKLIAIAPEQYATDLMAAMNETVIGRNAAVIGKVIETPAGKVLLKTILGSTRILDSLSGELLPRIC